MQTSEVVDLPRPAAPDKAAIVSSTLRAIALLLSVRLLLLLALLGGFSLAVVASLSSAQGPLYVLIAYAVLIVLPIVYLDLQKGPR